ncbi:MAG: hypothetical protein AB8G15_22955 [Saprospiraceae bacterium]
MNQFTFEGKQKTVLGLFMLLGLVCMGLTYITDDELHTRFWSNFLHNTVFFTGIAFVSTFVMAAFTSAYAGWHTIFRRIWEAYSLFLIVGLALLMVLIGGVWLHYHHLYHWTDVTALHPYVNDAGVYSDVIKEGFKENPNYDVILGGKSSFLNKYWYTFGTIITVGVWYLFAQRLRSLSLSEDENGDTSYSHHKKIKFVSAVFLPIAAFSSAAMIWQWVMSLDAHWYSTMFAWYATASWFVSALALTILMIIYLKSKGYLEELTGEHIHDLGKYMFAFSVFWTYLWFSQYMLIWYANNGEETVYFHTRMRQYPVLFYGNLIMNFALPFLILMRNETKRKFGTVGFTAALVFFAHWFDFFQMIKPSARINAEHAMHAHHSAGGHDHEAGGHAVDAGHQFLMGFDFPGFLDIGTFLGFAALFIFFAFTKMAQASLIPKNDPYLGESLHHHV